MRKWLLLFLVIIFSGCNSSPTQQLKTFISDPHYAQYQEKLDDLERQQLSGAISYAEYLERKRQLDQDYTKEVQKREQIIHGQQPGTADEVIR